MSFVKWFSKRTSRPTYKTHAPSLSESFTYHWGSSVDLSSQYIICKSCVCEPCSRLKSGVEHLSCGTTAVPETQSYIEIPLRLVKQPLSGRVWINANPRHFGNLPSVLGITPATNLKFTDCQEAHRSASFHWWFFRLLVLEYRPLPPLLNRHFIIDDSFSWFSDYLLSTITVKTGDFLHLLFSRPFLGRVYDYTVIAGLITPGFSRHYARLFFREHLRIISYHKPPPEYYISLLHLWNQNQRNNQVHIIRYIRAYHKFSETSTFLGICPLSEISATCTLPTAIVA